MAFPVLIEHCDGQFAATLVGVPTIRVVGSTRAEVLAALQTDLTQRMHGTRGIGFLGASPDGGVWAGWAIPHRSHPA